MKQIVILTQANDFAYAYADESIEVILIDTDTHIIEGLTTSPLKTLPQDIKEYIGWLLKEEIA